MNGASDTTKGGLMTETDQREVSVQMMAPVMERLNDQFIPSMYDVKTFIELKLKYGKIFEESDLFQITYYGDDMYRLTYYNKDQIIAKKTWTS